MERSVRAGSHHTPSGGRACPRTRRESRRISIRSGLSSWDSRSSVDVAKKQNRDGTLDHVDAGKEDYLRILVIGGTGFIGSGVVSELRRTGHEVATFARHGDIAGDRRAWR